MRSTISFITLFSFVMLLCNQPTTTNTVEQPIQVATTQSAKGEILNIYIGNLASSFDSIPADRKTSLDKLSQYIKGQLDSSKPARLTFICTHNSRRSHLAQIWAAAASAHYGIGNIYCYSGGTEATAFNPRAVAALQRASFSIVMMDSVSTNPKYKVQIPGGNAIICFSKKYNDVYNPSSGFAAVMTCSKADVECPFIAGASFRVALPYNDPKEADNTPEETSRYDERCRQIGTEMMYVFSNVK